MVFKNLCDLDESSHSTVRVKPCRQGIYIYPMRGNENKDDGQLISEPSCSSSGFYSTQFHCTPNGSYSYLYQIAIKSTSFGL